MDPRSKLAVGIFFAVYAQIALSGCGKRDYNVVLVTVDTMRSDHIGAYGYTKGSTPNMDSIGNGGTVFEVARTSVPLTLPAHSGVMTGVYPVTTSVRNNLFDKLGDGFTTLAEVLKGQGWQTGAVIASYVLDSKFGLAQGFDYYDDKIVESNVMETAGHPERRAGEVADLAVSWLRKINKKKPFFLWAHFYDPHSPYEPPPPYDEKFANSPYDGEAAYADEKIGYLLDELKRLGVYDNTIVVIVGDHGEGLGEHGETGHGLLIYESTMRVPFMMRVPKGKPGLRFKAPVELLDVMPTILGVLKIKAPGGVMGHDLSPVVLGKTAGESDGGKRIYYESRFAFDEYGWAFLQSIVVGKWKFIRSPNPELFDLDADPNETQNLASKDADSAKKFDHQLTALYKEIEPREVDAATVTIEERDRMNLLTLGYTSSRTQSKIPEDTSKLPDPKLMVEISHAIQEAQKLLGKGRPTEIIALLEPYVERDPNNTRLLMMIGQAAAEADDSIKAHEYYDKVLALKPDEPLTLAALGTLLLDEGRIDEAETVFGRIEKLNPSDPARFKYHAEIFAAKGLFEEAEKNWREYIKAVEQDAMGHLGLGLVLEKLNRPDEALKEYRLAVHYSPNMFVPRMRLGIILSGEGKFSEVAAMLEPAKEIRPESVEARYYLARAYMNMEPPKPMAALEEFRVAVRLKPTKAMELDCYENMARIAFAYHMPEAADILMEFQRSAMMNDMSLEDLERRLKEIKALAQ